MAACQSILKFGGLGHTCVIFSRDETKTRQFGVLMPAFRVLVNTSAPQGSTGITTNVFPSMTLGCGAVAGNITSDNVGPQHLINIKRIAYFARSVDEAFPSLPPSVKANAAAAGPAATVDRSSIVTAVERYLSERGVSVAASSNRNMSNSSSGSSSGMQTVIAGVVDRFPGLAARWHTPFTNPGVRQVLRCVQLSCCLVQRERAGGSGGSRSASGHHQRFRLRSGRSGRDARESQDLYGSAFHRHTIGA